MIILFKKAVRDMWRAKLRTLAIIVAIMMSVATGIGLVNATEDVFKTFDKRLDDTRYEDISIQFQTDTLDLDAIEEIPGVEQAMGRLLIKTQAVVDGTKYECHWIASPYHPDEPYSEVNGYQLNSGSYMSSPTARECVVGYLFADYN